MRFVPAAVAAGAATADALARRDDDTGEFRTSRWKLVDLASVTKVGAQSAPRDGGSVFYSPPEAVALAEEERKRKVREMHWQRQLQRLQVAAGHAPGPAAAPRTLANPSALLAPPLAQPLPRCSLARRSPASCLQALGALMARPM